MAQNILKIALAQLNPIVGDVAGNEQKAREARAEAARLGEAARERVRDRYLGDQALVRYAALLRTLLD